MENAPEEVPDPGDGRSTAQRSAGALVAAEQTGLGNGQSPGQAVAPRAKPLDQQGDPH